MQENASNFLYTLQAVSLLLKKPTSIYHIVIVYQFLLRLHKNLSSRLIINSGGFSSDSGQKNDNGDEEKVKPEQTKQKQASAKPSAVMNRLNELLTMINTDSQTELVKRVSIAQPSKQRREKAKKKQKGKEAGSDSDSDDEKPRDLLQATRKVATSLGGDASKTEAELLEKLLKGSDAGEAVPAGNLKNVITGMQVEKEGIPARNMDVKLTRSKLVRKSIEMKGRKEQGKTNI